MTALKWPFRVQHQGVASAYPSGPQSRLCSSARLEPRSRRSGRSVTVFGAACLVTPQSHPWRSRGPELVRGLALKT